MTPDPLVKAVCAGPCGRTVATIHADGRGELAVKRWRRDHNPAPTSPDLTRQAYYTVTYEGTIPDPPADPLDVWCPACGGSGTIGAPRLTGALDKAKQRGKTWRVGVGCG